LGKIWRIKIMGLLHWFSKKKNAAIQHIERNVSPAESLSWYRDAIESLYDLESTQPFSNSKQENIGLLFEFVFRTAKSSICIYDENLSSTYFNNPILAGFLAYAIKKGVRVDVVVKESPSPSKVLDVLRECKIPIYKSDWKQPGMVDEILIMDDTSLRVKHAGEQPHAVMYDKKLVSEWQRFFGMLIGDTILKKSTV
jgi:hypothetical protein